MYTKRSKRWLRWVSLCLLVVARVGWGQSNPLDFLWAKRATGPGNDFSDGAAVDSAGNVYLTGFFASSTVSFDSFSLTKPSAGSSDIFVTKYNSSGNAVWAKRAGGTKLDYSYGIAVDG